MATILLGNGFDIELGGRDYTNKSIINRLIKNIETKDYSNTLLNRKIGNDELKVLLPGLYDEFKKMLKGQYDKYCTDAKDISLLTMLKTRYGLSTQIDEIGMEDFFVILRLFHTRFHDGADFIKSTHDGFCWMFLDTIFNEERIQKIASTVLPAYKRYLAATLGAYDSIYTINYDKTAEIIAEKEVYYLHGDFETLFDQYNPDTLIGRYYCEKGVANPVNSATKHIYCNGLMGFSGAYKEHIMEIMDNGQFGVESILKSYNEGMAVQDLKKLERLKNSPDEGEQLAFGIISAKINFPHLGMHQYPIKKFRSITSELHIIGVSPYNDEHIWGSIIGNPRLTKIIYYYHGGSKATS
ncbi:MAG: hypothetical protein QMB62_10990 [Oscillospiraceae bacterium]